MKPLAAQLLLVTLSACSASGGSTPSSEPEWLTDTRQGCRIPASYASYAKEMSWDGQCRNGEAIGNGTLRWSNPDGTEGFFKTCLRPEYPESRCVVTP